MFVKSMLLVTAASGLEPDKHHDVCPGSAINNFIPFFDLNVLI